MATWSPRAIRRTPDPRSCDPETHEETSTDRLLASLLAAFSLLACAGTRPTDLGLHGATLAPCPASPNCVSSDASDPEHHVAAFELRVPAPEAWRAARVAVANLARTQIVSETSDYLHAECSSLIFRFVDDLELQLRAAEHVIAVRSASRLGKSDLGVNRRRVEALRVELARQGIVREAIPPQ
jgi:uncharacterized protein (DUF1499 family)